MMLGNTFGNPNNIAALLRKTDYQYQIGPKPTLPYLLLQLEERVKDPEVELLHEGIDVEPHLVLEELVLQSLVPGVDASTLKAGLVLAVDLGHLTDLVGAGGTD